MGYGLDDHGIGVQFRAGVRDFSLLHSVQTVYVAYPSSFPMDKGVREA
jgi:hypothetical protein